MTLPLVGITAGSAGLAVAFTGLLTLPWARVRATSSPVVGDAP